MIAINKQLTTAIVSSTGKAAEILGLYIQSKLRASESDRSDLHQPVLDSPNGDAISAEIWLWEHPLL